MILLAALLLGGLTGYVFGDEAKRLKPLGDIFLNLIFTTIVPLIFFSVSSAIARNGSAGKLGKIMSSMILVFIAMSLVAALYALGVVTLFPPAQGISLTLESPKKMANLGFTGQMADMFTVPDFAKLLSHEHLLALIVFSILVGLAVAKANDPEKTFARFLQAGEDVFMRVFSLIMYYAPIGFFAYFAYLVSELGPKIMENYARVAVIYYLSSILYFIVAYSGFAFLAGKTKAISRYWKHIFLPAATSIATCSSAASIPANLSATKAMGVPSEVYETVIPLGTIIHKDGSVLGGLFKIAFLFGIYHMDFSGATVLLTALGVSMLVGTVMGAIPSGGMLGEMLILSVYGFPPSVLIVIAAISLIIDPLATMLNVTGNSLSCLLIARLVEPKKT
jgi:Na+/H+-dicarboxylate symporter